MYTYAYSQHTATTFIPPCHTAHATTNACHHRSLTHARTRAQLLTHATTAHLQTSRNSPNTATAFVTPPSPPLSYSTAYATTAYATTTHSLTHATSHTALLMPPLRTHSLTPPLTYSRTHSRTTANTYHHCSPPTHCHTVLHCSLPTSTHCQAPHTPTPNTIYYTHLTHSLLQHANDLYCSPLVTSREGRAGVCV